MSQTKNKLVLIWGATTLVLAMGQQQQQEGTYYATGICRGPVAAPLGSDYQVAELNTLVPRATRLAIDPVKLSGNWYVHRGVAAGICHVRSREVCYRLCNATPGCLYFSTSNIQNCYACFVHRTCNRSRIWGISNYQVYAMPTASPTMQPTAHACSSASTHQCDTSSTTCTTNLAGQTRLTNSNGGLYACACRPGFMRSGGSATQCVQIPSPTTPAPSVSLSFHPCANGNHSCKSPSTVCTDIIGSNMTTIGNMSGGLAYSCACNRALGYTERINSWQCELASVLNVDDDPALDLAGDAVEMIRSLNATIMAQQQTINTLLQILRASANAATTPPQTQPGANPSIFRRNNGNLLLSGAGIEVSTPTCSNADVCGAASFAADLKSRLANSNL